MNVLIVGLGSIAQKHLTVLRELANDSQFWALRSRESASSFPGVTNIYAWKDCPVNIDFILIANPTHLHANTLRQALKQRKPIFLEKPPFMTVPEAEDMASEVAKSDIPVYTAFNLRFHPVIQWAKSHIVPAEVLEVQAYCGSYLPEWRPTQDYRKSYSAFRDMGGGVHLDLIHELDYLVHLFGHPESSYGFVSQFSELAIKSVDYAHYWLQYAGFGASVTLNYFRRDTKRTLEIVTRERTFMLDILRGEVLDKSTGTQLFSCTVDSLHTYRMQMKYFLSVLRQADGVVLRPSLAETVSTLKIALDVIEK